MKKILISALLLLSSITFAVWETIELKDEFQDKTGEIVAINFTDKGFVRHQKHPKDGIVYDMFWINLGEYVGELGSTVKMKVDNNEPLQYFGLVFDNGKSINLSIDEKLINQMKKGNTLKYY